MQVTICIITYQRPTGLKRLMNGLNQLKFSRIERPQLQVVIVDNDASGTACQLAEQMSDFQWPLVTEIEPRRGISYARNRAVACAHPDSDFIVFIDDDEVPSPEWLEELLVVQAQYQSDVVQGRVVPYFQDDVPVWVKKGSFFEQPQRTTGTPLEAAYTNNVLVRASLIKCQETVFDERFALTGGEDSYFFRTLHQQGFSLVWADAAVVFEYIPSSRVSTKWILLRAYRSCLTYTIWEREKKASFKALCISVIKAVSQICLGVFLLPLSLFLERHILVKTLLNIYKGAGRLSAFMGIKYEEYKTTHGV
jgi:glycosyltransferase involved in cell wall biosynthesis